jgi:O-acetyl-ADP-ribose deacetylase (regulator of RNase III)
MTVLFQSFHSSLSFLFSTLLLLTKMSSAWTRIATFSLSPSTTLSIIRGSVVDFAPSTSKAAIVNAANPACLGGGGVDGAIATAGGPNLRKHRMALPLLPGGVRCPTGHAKLTGPGDYGDLRVPFVIHAVGPCYCDYDELSEGDALLASAYRESLEQAHSAKLEQVAFSLLSAGVYRGEQTLHNVLLIGIETILEWTQQQHDEKESSLTQVYMCGFNARECNALLDICEDDLKLEAVHEHEANDSMAAEDEEETNNDACVNGDATDDKSECTNDDSADGTTKETKEETMNDAADAAAGKENGSNGVQEKQRDL